jgi:hypothetical protein
MIGNDRNVVVGAGIAIALAICCLGSLAAIFFLFSDQSLALFGAASPTAPRSTRRTLTPTEEAFAIFVGDATVTASSTNTLIDSSKPTGTRTPAAGFGTPTKSPGGLSPRMYLSTFGLCCQGNIFEGQKTLSSPKQQILQSSNHRPQSRRTLVCTEQEAVANGWRKGE